jgi:outer membrane protein assembly factor BamB
MKPVVLIILLCFTLFACGLFNKEPENKVEPRYNARIAWDSGLYSNCFQSHTVYGDFVFFYERPPGHTLVNIYTLTKLDVKTGEFIWRTFEFSDVVFSQPVMIGDYVYVFLEPSIIVSFTRATGELTAIIQVDIDNKNLNMSNNIIPYREHLYMGFWGGGHTYFARLNLNLVQHSTKSEDVQTIIPEILWEPKNGNLVSAVPVVHENVIYTGTFSPGGQTSIEVVGFCIHSGEMVFYITFGGPEDNDDNIRWPPEDGVGLGSNPILIHDNVLYYLSWSISAWNLNTGEKLYRHIFTYDIPNSRVYSANLSLQAVFYGGRIYYTSGSSHTPKNSFHNIHCIDAATGRLVWNTIAYDSETLWTNPIIAHGRLYVTQHNGLYVYNPSNGRLIGVDRSFCGAGLAGRNVLHNDYMITVQKNRDTGAGKLVAVYVGP